MKGAGMTEHSAPLLGPAAGYKNLSGQTVELPVYRFSGMELKPIGAQSFTFPEKDEAPNADAVQSQA